MILVDPETKEIVDANPAACRFYGYSRAELVGMSVYQINSANSQEIDAKINCINTRESHSFEFVHRLADGSHCEVEVFCGPTGCRRT